MIRLFLCIVCILWLSSCDIMPGSSREQAKEQLSSTGVETVTQQFIQAAEAGDLEAVQNLLQDGIDINAQDERGRTAVMAATYNHQTEMVRLLISKGADINIRDHLLNNVFLYAGAEGMLDIVQLAIEADADTKLTNRYGGTALIPASERGHVEVVRELLTRTDIDVNHINRLHWTALLEAVILGNGGEKHQQIVRLLVDHGADREIADAEGITPLQHAKSKGYHEIAAILERAGS